MSLSLLLKKLSLLFLLISALFLSVSFAGRPSKLVNKFVDQENVEHSYDQSWTQVGLVHPPAPAEPFRGFYEVVHPQGRCVGVLHRILEMLNRVGEVKKKLRSWEIPNKALDNNEVASINERLLKANTKDYGRYDPAPALVRPPFKLIPN